MKNWSPLWGLFASATETIDLCSYAHDIVHIKIRINMVEFTRIDQSKDLNQSTSNFVEFVKCFVAQTKRGSFFCLKP